MLRFIGLICGAIYGLLCTTLAGFAAVRAIVFPELIPHDYAVLLGLLVSFVLIGFAFTLGCIHYAEQANKRMHRDYRYARSVRMR